MTTSQQATRAAIVAAVRAFVQRVDRRAYQYPGMSAMNGAAWCGALYAELAALERTVAAEGEGA